MKKFLPVFIICLFVYSSGIAQFGLSDFTKSYFRSNPFTGEFSSFLKQLLNDPSIQDKQIRHRTDTSLFSFAGDYSSYSRFFFKPTRVTIALEQVPVQFEGDKVPDTIFVYSLIAYADTTVSGGQDVQKEFDKIHRLFRRKFDENNYHELKAGENKAGAVHNYFVNPARLAAVTIAWGKTGTNQYALNLIVRLKAKSNMAVLPVAFNNP